MPDAVKIDIPGASIAAATNLILVEYFYVPQVCGFKDSKRRNKLVGDLKPKGETIFTTSGNFIIPNSVKEISVFCVGSGGGGFSNQMSGCGGGGGGYANTKNMKLYDNNNVYRNEIHISIGAPSNSAGSAGSTIVSNTINSVNAKGGVTSYNYLAGANGGSGGGASASGNSSGRMGGSDGSDGYSNDISGGKGQGTTTRAFGEVGGTLYAGGGGGGGYYCGLGGAGGGGRGGGEFIGATMRATPYNWPDSGAANTGGGGGGSFVSYNSTGGSGIAIIRWGY